VSVCLRSEGQAEQIEGAVLCASGGGEDGGEAIAPEADDIAGERGEITEQVWKLCTGSGSPSAGSVRLPAALWMLRKAHRCQHAGAEPSRLFLDGKRLRGVRAHRRYDQRPASPKRILGSRVRNGLTAGAKRIRTLSPTRVRPPGSHKVRC
jgi:hypothetical protein